ncbi:MAG: hypothetical protein JO027_06840 [Solirubrobacterales bacterium]|nr:hypothetical protein [Solirubrobacterales bacterium]
MAVRRLALIALIIALGAPVPAALADGDPASDTLLAEPVFYPYSANVAPALQARLNAEAAAASRKHFPILVALIAAPSDLGAVPSLFGKPRQYAAFLEQEINFLDAKDVLLVVMSKGYGVQHAGVGAQAALASLKQPAGARADDLAQAAIEAVPKLAAAAGHPLGSIAGGSRATTSSSTLKAIVLAISAIVIAGGLVALRAVRVGRHSSRGSERRGYG